MADTDEAAGLKALVGFGRALRGAGFPVGTERVLAYTRAAAALGPSDLQDLYWAGRLTLVGRREEIAAYDGAFAAYFAGAPLGRARPGGGIAVRVSVDGELPGEPFPYPDGNVREEVGRTRELAVAAASPTEVLRRKSFERYTKEEHEQARAIIAQLATRKPRRRSRRTRPARRRGLRPDLPRTVRRALRTDGEMFERLWRRRRVKPRRLVLILDISGSMGAYARSLARFAHAAVQAGRSVEAFAFGTRLTRITPALRARDPTGALRALGRAVPDWESGTRIGDSLKELLHRWGRGGPVRGAVTVILSDGLERGDPEHLTRQMHRLSRLAHRVVWVNPLKGSPDYEPLARGMAAALPYVDAFLSGHNLASLESLVEVVGQLGGG